MNEKAPQSRIDPKKTVDFFKTTAKARENPQYSLLWREVVEISDRIVELRARLDQVREARYSIYLDSLVYEEDE